MKPVKDNILILPVNEAQTDLDKYGVDLPDYADNVLPFRGKVIEVGPDIRDIKKGDMVIFDQKRAGLGINNNGHKVKYKDKEYLILPHKLILAIYVTP